FRDDFNKWESYTTFLDNSNGESKYYRKKDGVYYQYLTSAFGQTLDSPIELTILKDNVPLNTPWESVPYKFQSSLSGVSTTITAKLKSRISRAHFSDVINGVTYSDMIEVTSDLYVQDIGSTTFSLVDSIRTIFARGIGIVFYQDPSVGIDWGILNYTVNN
ncbi:MAG: hypothetical protein H0X41_10810, partial [Chitinophagaceae bacterium]|nr:hypothetical protein [Chitinophagaceae bacterium]